MMPRLVAALKSCVSPKAPQRLSQDWLSQWSVTTMIRNLGSMSLIYSAARKASSQALINPKAPNPGAGVWRPRSLAFRPKLGLWLGRI